MMIRKTLLCWVLAIFCLPGVVLAQTDRTRIHDTAYQVEPLLPGMPAPEFQVLDASGNPVKFNPESMEKPVIMIT